MCVLLTFNILYVYIDLSVLQLTYLVLCQSSRLKNYLTFSNHHITYSLILKCTCLAVDNCIFLTYYKRTIRNCYAIQSL